MKVSYEKTIYGQCLVLSLQKGTKIIDFQIEMIRYNPHPQILPVEKRNLNNQTELCYQLGEHLSLEQYCYDHENMLLNEILKIMESIINCINISRDYLLYGYGFLLDMRYIFIHPRTKSIAMVYQPVKLTDDLNAKLKGLLEMLMTTVSMDNFKKEKDILKQVEEYRNKKEFCLAGLQNLIRETKVSYRMNKLELQKPQELGKPFRLSTVIEDSTKQNSGMNRVYFFFLFQVILMFILACFLDDLERIGNAIIIFGLAIASLTVANILAIDKYILKKKSIDKKEEKVIMDEGWQGQLVEKMVREKDILRKEFAHKKEGLFGNSAKILDKSPKRYVDGS